jgi:outer membrane phospholipase A
MTIIGRIAQDSQAIAGWVGLALGCTLSMSCAQVALAGDLTLALRAAEVDVVQAGTARIDLVAINGTTSAAEFPLGEQIPGTIAVGANSWPVMLRALPGNAPPPVAPGGSTARRYEMDLPAAARGTAILTINSSTAGTLQAVLDIGPATAATNAEATPAETSRAAAFVSQRTFSNRLSVHEPIYFIAGDQQPRIKFQLSLKYRLHTFGDSPSADAPHTLQLGYTQRSLWVEGGGTASHFYDTSYMPEVFYQWLPTITAGSEIRGFTWLGLQSGLRHESNGKDGADARSINLAYVRLGFSFGSPQGWHLILLPQIYGYVGGVNENPDIETYRGHTQLTAVVQRGNNVSLRLNLVPGGNFEHGSREWNLEIPIRIRNFGFYGLVQYFDGYGESLLGYNQRSSVLRGGFELVR